LRRAHPSREIRGIVCDVSDSESVRQAAQEAINAFGNIHLLCNNAGVAGGSGIDDISIETWRRVLDVNLMGVVNGIKAFLPHIRAHGEGGHVVNTASMAGLNSDLGLSPYSASKFAVVNISEGLAKQVSALGIGVTVVCPGFVRTRIVDSTRDRPERYGSVTQPHPASASGKLASQQAVLAEAGLDPMAVASQVLTAIRENHLYVFTHTEGEWRNDLQERFNRIRRAMDKGVRRTR
jgi:NAD(P)-dependent dehydrogenase (short-subunit alcohol dehydrogenase family)